MFYCFHNPDEDNGFLSNWYKSEFTYEGIIFFSAEQVLMYKKALIFGDGKIALDIMCTHDVAKIKALGRKIKDYNEEVWESNRKQLMCDILYAKFTCDVYIRILLLETEDETLVECAVKDKIWGVGFSMTDERRFDKSKWRGRNLLGKYLMKVRDRIKQEEKII